MTIPPTPDSFDDLSRRWQQQPPDPAGAPATWPAPLARGAHSPVTRMVRNAWVEIISGSLLTVPVIFVLLHLPGTVGRGLAAAVIGISAFSLWYYYRQLTVLGHLRTLGLTMRAHAAGQIRQLRGLLRLNHYAVLGLTAGAGSTLLYLLARYVAPQLPAATANHLLSWGGLSVLVGLLITHWCLRWHAQHTYGQHLDQLETVLRELEDEPT